MAVYVAEAWMSFMIVLNLLQSAPNTQPLSSGVTQVVELDGVIGELAKRHFGFVENDRMKVLYILPP